MYVQLDTPVPGELFVGKGYCLYVSGWVADSDKPIQGLSIGYGEGWTELLHWRLPRLDAGPVWWERKGSLDGFSSGFWALVPFLPVDTDRDIDLRLQAVYTDGGVADVSIGSIRLHPGTGAEPAEIIGPPPRVAILMATYNPPPHLFARQIDSLRQQTVSDWVCLIQDDGSSETSRREMTAVIGTDPRFRLFEAPDHAGVYLNFERLLRRAPTEAVYIALADQDDDWHPDKLETQVRAIEETGANLVYSDMRLVSDKGEILSNTFWFKRQNNATDLEVLLLVNTVTGAAALFRRELLDDILPFPPAFDATYHDWWIALVALSAGTIAYIDRPLHDYTQHAANAVGIREAPVWAWKDYLAVRQHFVYVYHHHLVPRRLMAKLLLLRIGFLPADKKEILQTFAFLSDTPAFYRILRKRGRDREHATLGTERLLSLGFKAYHLSRRLITIERYFYLGLHYLIIAKRKLGRLATPRNKEG